MLFLCSPSDEKELIFHCNSFCLFPSSFLFTLQRVLRQKVVIYTGLERHVPTEEHEGRQSVRNNDSISEKNMFPSQINPILRREQYRL